MRRARAEETEAIQRRLALLSAELAASGVRGTPDRTTPERDTAEPPVGGAATAAAVPDGDDGHTRVRPTLWDPWVPHQPSSWTVASGQDQSGEADPVHRGGLDEEHHDLEDEPATRVPTPGRHSAHRTRTPPRWWAALALAPRHLTVVALVVALGLGGTTWWVLRGDAGATPVGSVGVTPLGAAPTAAASTGTAPEAGASVPPAHGSAVATPAGEVTGEVTVDVAGKVRHPGVRVLPAGSRVVDALEAAGGARRGVDLSPLNLARVLADGEQILVGVPGGGPVAGGAPTTGSATLPAGGLVNLNAADPTLLETLPGVGPVTAGAIVAWRTENGGFTSVDQLVEVDGIGEATLAKLTPLVTV